MADQTFGGEWTERKLLCLGKYLVAYRTIFSGNKWARRYQTWYVDAFAGTGELTASDVNETTPEDAYTDKDGQQYRDESAAIALRLNSPFDQYLFIEKSRKRINSLKQLVDERYPQLKSRCDFKQEDANVMLMRWCSDTNWSKERAIVFLDPFGMQVDWQTIETIAHTQGIDLWYLFPVGVGVMRMLTHDGIIEETWQKRLQRA